MKRADNPILLWLINRAFHMEASRHHAVPPDEVGEAFWNGQRVVLQNYQQACRWLDAEDEWALNLQYIRDGNKHLDWVMWRDARMAEAGVL